MTKTKFLQTKPRGKKELIISNIQEKGDTAFVKLSAGEHLIENMESELINFDIRVGDTVKFQGEVCKGIVPEARPLDAVPYKRKK